MACTYRWVCKRCHRVQSLGYREPRYCPSCIEKKGFGELLILRSWVEELEKQLDAQGKNYTNLLKEDDVSKHRISQLEQENERLNIAAKTNLEALQLVLGGKTQLEKVAEVAREYYNNRKPGIPERIFSDKELHDKLGQALAELDKKVMQMSGETLGDWSKVSPNNIWEYPQNRLRLVLRDFESLGIPQETTRKILLARGVYKWMACRLDIIHLKDELKAEIRGLYEISRQLPNGNLKKITLERVHALEEVRAKLRSICHSDRWRLEAE